MDGVPVKLRAASEGFRASFWLGASVSCFSVVAPYRLPWLRVGELGALCARTVTTFRSLPDRSLSDAGYEAQNTRPFSISGLK